ncbi:hypothetical protein ACFE04_007711 [Oxalis oulophora]
MLILKLTFLLCLSPLPLTTLSLSSCRSSCGNIPIHYPFSLDDGCGHPQYRHMLNCTTNTTDLFFLTPSGSYKVQSIDYIKKTMTIYDPAMSTCSILQPHHDFILTDLQSVILPPSSDTVFALMNCSVDSPVLNHYKSLCFNFSGHSCNELYTDCSAFKLFHTAAGLNTPTPLLSPPSPSLPMLSPPSALLTPPSPFLSPPSLPMLSPPSMSSQQPLMSSPPCCFTTYDTVKYMSMNILDCTHYTSVINTDNLKGVGPMDWVYGIKLGFDVADSGCERCMKSGGTCGFDTETQIVQCLCSSFRNATRECGAGIDSDGGSQNTYWPFIHSFSLALGSLIYMSL